MYRPELVDEVLHVRALGLVRLVQPALILDLLAPHRLCGVFVKRVVLISTVHVILLGLSFPANRLKEQSTVSIHRPCHPPVCLCKSQSKDMKAHLEGVVVASVVGQGLVLELHDVRGHLVGFSDT